MNKDELPAPLRLRMTDGVGNDAAHKPRPAPGTPHP